MRETKSPTTTATDRQPTKAKVEKESRHQQTWVAVEADFSDPVPDDVLDAETSEFGSTATSSILQHGPSALLQHRTSTTPHFGSSPFSPPTPIPFSGKNFTHIPARGNRSLSLQPKLTVGAAHDEYEEEADEVADQIMRLPTSNLTGTIEANARGADNAQQRRMADNKELRTKPTTPTITPLVRRALAQRKEDNGDEVEDEEEATQTTDLVQRPIEDDAQIQPKRASAAESFEMDADFERRLDATHDRGAPLSNEIRTFMEPRFQADFSGVRVHADSEAGELNRAVSARAFTLGQDIYLGEGQVDLNSDNGKRLLAHELTHVVQQGHANQLRRAPEDEEQPEGQQTETSAPESTQPDTTTEATSSPEEQRAAPPEQVERTAPIAEKERATTTPLERASNAKDTPTEDSVKTQSTGALRTGDIAPRSPQEDESFQAVSGKVKQVTTQEKIHAPATVESANAQAAAVPPSNEVTSKAQDQHVQEMEQQKPGEFNAAAFKAALMARIQEVAPKNLQEADEFKSSNKLKSVKDSAKTEVAEGKKQATGPLQENARKEPDTSGIKPKSVTPLKEPQVGPPPPNVDAAQATPKPKGQSEIETPLQQDSQSLDQRMAEAGVTEEQLEQSNEPDFQAALAAKREAQASATESPQAYRKQETQIITGAQDQAEASATAQLNAIHDERDSVLNQVAGLQGETKSSDEEARATVANAIAPIYQKTKQDVEGILNSLDGSVSEKFDAGAEKARKQFEDYVDQRMKAYKKKRYGGLFGWAKWLKDKLAGMPSEVNKFYEEGRARYMQVMDDELNGIAEHVAAKLNEAKARIAQGRQEIQEYVAQLPENLQQIGAEAAQEMQGRFDELEQDLGDKQTELIDDLAQKYQDNLKEIDARIEELKAANAGLISKAFNFIKNVITTIVSLAAMLAKILAKAAAAIPKIILHPINFLKNLIQGVKQGLHNFVANIGTHLGQGLMSWLTGTMGGAGLQLPEKMDLKGIFHLVLQTLGITWENIRARAVNILGEKAVKYLEKGFQIFKVLSTQGLSGLWEFIKDKIGDLKTMVFGAIKEMVTSKIVKAGMRILASMLAGPAGGFVAAIKTIINIVKWFLTNGKRIMALIDAILDSILAIASGSVDEAAKKIEDSLAKTIPLVLSFLADLVGIGDLSGEIRKILTKIRNPINKAIDWVLKEAKKFAKKIGQKLGIGDEEEKAKNEAHEALYNRFGPQGASRSEVGGALQSDLGMQLNTIKQRYSLAELKPVAPPSSTLWGIEARVQRQPKGNRDVPVKSDAKDIEKLFTQAQLELLRKFHIDPHNIVNPEFFAKALTQIESSARSQTRHIPDERYVVAEDLAGAVELVAKYDSASQQINYRLRYRCQSSINVPSVEVPSSAQATGEATYSLSWDEKSRGKPTGLVRMLFEPASAAATTDEAHASFFEKVITVLEYIWDAIQVVLGVVTGIIDGAARFLWGMTIGLVIDIVVTAGYLIGSLIHGVSAIFDLLFGTGTICDGAWQGVKSFFVGIFTAVTNPLQTLKAAWNEYVKGIQERHSVYGKVEYAVSRGVETVLNVIFIVRGIKAAVIKAASKGRALIKAAEAAKSAADDAKNAAKVAQEVAEVAQETANGEKALKAGEELKATVESGAKEIENQAKSAGGQVGVGAELGSKIQELTNRAKRIKNRAFEIADDMGANKSSDVEHDLIQIATESENIETALKNGQPTAKTVAEYEESLKRLEGRTREIEKRLNLARDYKADIPDNEGFAAWFNNISYEEFMKYWNDPAANKLIQDRIRYPRGYHEWLKVSQTPRLKSWGVTMEQIQEARPLATELEGKTFKHGGTGSTAMHNKLDEMFNTSNSFEDFLTKLNKWADVELFNGRKDLPPHLQR